MVEEGGLSVRSGSADPVAAALERAVHAAAEGAERVTVLYSGGLDSSIVAHLARRSAAVSLLVAGTADARDLATARAGARELGLPLTEVSVTAEEVWAAAQMFADELTGLPEPTRSVALATAVVLRPAPDRRVLWGQGADELFFGYARYRTMAPDLVRAAAAEDLRRLCRVDNPRAGRIAERLGHDLRSPFLDDEVMAAVRAAPPELPSATVAKPGLRRIGSVLGLPPGITDRPKRALQYGSGVHRVVRGGPPGLRPSDPGPRLAPEGTSERGNVGDDEPAAPGGKEA